MSARDVTYRHLIASRNGVDGLINNTPYRFLITEDEDSKENEIDLKNIITDYDLKQGDYITFNNILHMIIDTQKVINSKYTKGTFREVLKITYESNLKDVYAVVDKIKGVYVQGQLITEVHDQYNFIVPKSSCPYTSINTATNLIIYAGASYDAISIDDSKEGILIITGRRGVVYNPHVYTISLSKTSKTLVELETYQIVATCTDNGTVVSNPQLEFVSSDPLIATVDNTGVVSCIKAGSCNITVNFNNISATVALTVNAKPSVPVISYTDNWSLPVDTTGLKQYCTSVYVVTRSTNAVVENPLIDYVFDSAGQSLISSGKIVVTRKTDNSFSVKNALISSTLTCHVTITDHANGHIIKDNQLLTFIKGI